ncbi:hypothetical protein HZF05_02575 [Sphingomonas sp. CGMCC 1.13654]|uniref:Uncharacterized protein n=1 Tax=Sphingomonas chungangi TaxID=2683589 RepID=A0A838L0F7_9SPHN|nr:hypothetical protein [Sphingomonas chungangi]MBA2932973.1 hypothetical protein [Sphingomonas chungangi]MVW56593.1 hypothetical protein [Sphingomonas chungangi]
MATKRTVVPAGPVKWTKTRERTFLEHLALSSNVAASERVALVPPGAAYKHRIRSADFRRNWEVALTEGYARLELAMLERAINGVTVEVTRSGVTTKKIEYSEGMAMTLLKAHRSSVTAIAAGQAADAIDADVLAVIDGMARRIGHDG